MAETEERLPPTTQVIVAEQLAREGETAAGTLPPDIPGRDRAGLVRRIIVYVVLFLISLLYFIPFFWDVTTSLKTLPETVGFHLWPKDPSLKAYDNALTTFNFS